MKRNIFLFTAIAATLTLQAQDTLPRPAKLTGQEIYQDAKAGVKDIVQGVKDLAVKLEGPAKHVYSVYIQQHKIRGMAMGVISMFLTVLGIVLTMSVRKTAKLHFHEDDSPPNMQWFLRLVGFFCVLGGIVCIIVFFGDNYFSKVINPEYYAIQDIINAFK